MKICTYWVHRKTHQKKEIINTDFFIDGDFNNYRLIIMYDKIFELSEKFSIGEKIILYSICTCYDYNLKKHFFNYKKISINDMLKSVLDFFDEEEFFQGKKELVKKGILIEKKSVSKKLSKHYSNKSPGYVYDNKIYLTEKGYVFLKSLFVMSAL